VLAEYIRLSEATRGTYRIERIAGELSSILPILKELQLKPNTIVEVVAQTPEYTVIRQNSMLRNVAKHVAFTVLLIKSKDLL
jgi:predicted SAM-dependent methyltransferase